MDQYAAGEEAGKAGGGAGSGQVEASASITPTTFPRGTPAPYLLTIIVAKKEMI